jgi:hypothetical protein
MVELTQKITQFTTHFFQCITLPLVGYYVKLPLFKSYELDISLADNIDFKFTIKITSENLE